MISKRSIILIKVNMPKRYCDIRATSLDEIIETANRHIKNITLTELDLIDCEDGTSTDFWYINMFRDTWRDLRDDAIAMKEKEKK